VAGKNRENATNTQLLRLSRVMVLTGLFWAPCILDRLAAWQILVR
jgi:hypothetical protein